MYKKVLFSVMIVVVLMGSASALNISPESFNINVKQNQYKVGYLAIGNTVNHSINLVLSTDLPITFSQSSFSLSENQSKNITLYFFGQTTDTGNITVVYDSNTVNIPVVLTVELDDEDVTIFPINPVSGKLFAISLLNPSDTSGFLWVKEQLIPLVFTDGFATAMTEQAIYGDAQLWINGKGFIYDFEILCGLEGVASFDIPTGLKIGDVAHITLNVGGEPLSGVSVVLTDPDDYEYEFKTDGAGKIHPVMDEVGDWVVKSSFKDKQLVSTIPVSYKSLSITVDKDTYKVGDKVGVTFDVNTVNVVIKKESAIMLQTTVDTGFIEFYPEQSGTYQIQATTEDKQGSKNFIVNMPTSIRILDANNMQTSILKMNENYIIQVIDEKGNPVSAYDNIMVSQGRIISLNNGIGFWKPDVSGSTTLSVGDNNNYVGSILTISIEGEDNNMIFIIPLVFVLVVILLYFLIKKDILSIPKLPKRKKIPDKIL